MQADRFSRTILEDDDRELALRAKRRDRQAWHSLIETYQPLFMRIANGNLGMGVAEEAVQEMWTRVIAGIGEFQTNAGSFRAWMMTIAKHCCIDIARRNQRRARHEEDIDISLASVEPADRERSRAGSTSERELEIEAAIDRLSPPLREVVLLKYVERLSAKEIAERAKHVPDLPLEQRVTWVYQATHRARTMLRRLLEGQDDE